MEYFLLLREITRYSTNELKRADEIEALQLFTEQRSSSILITEGEARAGGHDLFAQTILLVF